MTRLGMLYHDAIGVERDPGQAADWWRRGAERGDADAQAMLGAAHHLGSGVTLDRSRRWSGCCAAGPAAARWRDGSFGPCARRCRRRDRRGRRRAGAPLPGRRHDHRHRRPYRPWQDRAGQSADRRRRRPVEGGKGARHHHRSRLRLSAGEGGQCSVSSTCRAMSALFTPWWPAQAGSISPCSRSPPTTGSSRRRSSIWRSSICSASSAASSP